MGAMPKVLARAFGLAGPALFVTKADCGSMSLVSWGSSAIFRREQDTGTAGKPLSSVLTAGLQALPSHCFRRLCCQGRRIECSEALASLALWGAGQGSKMRGAWNSAGSVPSRAQCATQVCGGEECCGRSHLLYFLRSMHGRVVPYHCKAVERRW